MSLDHSGAAVKSVEAIIRTIVRSHFADRYGGELRALILTGSLARSEGTIVEKNGAFRVMGDAEFLLIFPESVRALPGAADLKADCERIEAVLSERGISCDIGANRAYPVYLRRMKPHIFGYELRKCGQTLLGDPNVLSLIPPFTAQEIPLEDGWQLLMNRLIELLKATGDPGSMQYRTVKLWLDMASSLLVFAGAFEAGYGARQERLSRASRSIADPPFAMEDFAGHVAEATERKLSGDPGSLPSDWGYLETALSYAHRLWRWELARMTGLRPDEGDAALMKKWAGRQPLSARLRGWVSLLRRPGLRRELLRDPHWLANAWRTSPRHCVYAAGADLVFRLPGLMRSRAPERSLLSPASARRLPLRAEGTGAIGWSGCARNIARNYEELLIGTRA